MLQTYQGLGRGRGFSVVSRESGIEDRILALALKPKLLDLLSVLTAHGHISKSDIIKSMGEEGPTQRTDVASTGVAEPGALKEQRTADTETPRALEGEVAEVRLSLFRLLGQWRDAERREALSQRRLDEIRERTERLAAETRRGLERVERLQAEVGTADRGAKELAELVCGMRVIAKDVQALSASQAPRSQVTSRDSGAQRA